MGKVLLIACTNVGRHIIKEIEENKSIQSELVGVVNLNAKQSISKANYDSYADLAVRYPLDIHYCNNINDAETMEFICSKKPDIIL